MKVISEMFFFQHWGACSLDGDGHTHATFMRVIFLKHSRRIHTHIYTNNLAAEFTCL